MPSKTRQTPCIFKINARSLAQNLPKLHIPPIFAISISTHRSKKNHRACVALPTFKAYIEVDNAAGAVAPLFIALPTAVEAAKVQTTKAGATYDLTGRRVQQTAKGQVYVRDGKKFVQQ
jgi:hypothetical protein